MTPKQKEIYNFMKSYYKENKRPAGLKVIQRLLGYKYYQTVQHHINLLIEKGKVINPERGVYIAK